MIEINASRSVRIPTPYDAKSCNYYYKGDILNPSAIVVETILEYLARVTTNLRSAGHPVTIELPKEGYDILPEYPIGDWDAALANFDTHYYTFVGGLADENFVEILMGGHPPVTMDPESAERGSIGDDQVLHIKAEPGVDGLIRGGLVSWIEGFLHAVSSAQYRIASILYISRSNTVLLEAAHPTLPRFDTVVVNTASLPEVITGVPAENPVKPQVDLSLYVELTSILVPAASTQPEGITDEIIFDENTEWTPTPQGVVVDFNSLTAPFHGVKCSETGTLGNGDAIVFTAVAPVNAADYKTFSMALKLKAAASTKNAVFVQFSLAGVPVTQERPITWSIVDITNWQSIVMPLSDFTFSEATFDSVRVRWVRVQGTNTHAGIFLDLLKLQAGLEEPEYNLDIELTGDVLAKGKPGTPIGAILKNVIAAGTFGSATKSLTITVDSKGRITAVTENDIEGGTGGGEDGREVELSTSGGYVVWRYVGDVAWTNLFPVPGDGDDGVAVEMSVQAGYVAWRYVTGGAWTPLYAVPKVPLQVTGITLLQASWSLVSGLYEYNLANVNITANSIVEPIPENASIAIIKAAEILPKTVSSAGSVKFYSTNAPSGNISITINITEATI